MATAFGANTGVTRESLIAASGPYVDVLVPYLDWVAAAAYPGAQTAAEVAAAVVGVLSDPRPPLRVPTSSWAREYAARKLADVDGSAVQKMTRSWLGL